MGVQETKFILLNRQLCPGDKLGKGRFCIYSFIYSLLVVGGSSAEYSREIQTPKAS